MLKTEDLDRAPAACAWAAARDARMRDAVNRSRYTDIQVAKTDGVMACLGLCYHADSFYKNYRKTCIVIKIENPDVVDRRQLRMLEDSWKTEALYREVRKKRTPQGICYEFFFT